MLSCFSHVQAFTTPWTVAPQAPLSKRFSRQEYWSGLPFPSSGDFLTQGSKPYACISCIGRWIFHHSTTWEAVFKCYTLLCRFETSSHKLGFPDGSAVQNLPANAGDARDPGLIPGLGRSPGEGNGNPPLDSCLENGQRSLAACSPWDHRESDTTERLSTVSNKPCLQWMNFMETKMYL